MLDAHWLTTTRAEGDFRIDAPPAELAARRRAVVDAPWVWLRQVHGADVIVVDGPAQGAASCGSAADALVTAVPGVVLAVQTADCAPVVFASPEGVIGIAHAGWRGVRDGVIHHTVEAMRQLGATRIVGATGPCIGPECYEFGPDALDPLARAYGEAVRGRTAEGQPALDLRAAVAAAAASVDVVLDAPVAACTACDPAQRYFSHRARGERGRMATVIWREAAP